MNVCQTGDESASGNSRTGVGPIASSMNRRQIVAGNVPPATEMPWTFVIGISAWGYPTHTEADSVGVIPQNQASA